DGLAARDESDRRRGNVGAAAAETVGSAARATDRGPLLGRRLGDGRDGLAVTRVGAGIAVPPPEARVPASTRRRRLHGEELRRGRADRRPTLDERALPARDRGTAVREVDGPLYRLLADAYETARHVPTVG